MFFTVKSDFWLPWRWLGLKFYTGKAIFYLRPRLHGSGQTFARTKACTVPPCVYTDRRNWTNFWMAKDLCKRPNRATFCSDNAVKAWNQVMFLPGCLPKEGKKRRERVRDTSDPGPFENQASEHPNRATFFWDSVHVVKAWNLVMFLPGCLAKVKQQKQKWLVLKFAQSNVNTTAFCNRICKDPRKQAVQEQNRPCKIFSGPL